MQLLVLCRRRLGVPLALVAARQDPELSGLPCSGMLFSKYEPILTTIHLNCGAPGRATKLTEISLQNTTVNIRWCFYGLEVITAFGYTKSRSARYAIVDTVYGYVHKTTSEYFEVF